jgi:predicted HicB family RNase H-like nuclease
MKHIPLHGSLFIGPYKGYHGRAEYDADERNFHGRVVETRDVISFVANEPAGLEKAFKESVDDYLEFCRSRGEEPNKPFSALAVRMPSKLYHALSIAADKAEKSMNQYVLDVLSEATKPEGQAAASDALAAMGSPFEIANVPHSYTNTVATYNSVVLPATKRFKV